MKLNFNTAILLPLLAAILFLNSCESNTAFPNADQHAKIYMPQAVEYPAEHSFIMADTAQTIIYGAAYGGPGYPGAAIDVRFDVDYSLVDSFNAKNGTSYLPMPEGSYELSQLNSSIPGGGITTQPLKLQIKTIGAIQAVTQYLLPVNIAEINGNASINESLQTTYFLIRGTFTEFSRSGWEVIDVDSEQNPSYPAANIIDGNHGTFWHTQYSPERHPLPHHVTIDMGETKKFHGLRIVKRLGFVRGNPKEIIIEVSSDGENWEHGETFSTTFDKDNENSFYLSSTREARYFKITVTASLGWDNPPITHFAELYGF